MSENKRVMKKEWTMITKEKQQESIVHGKKVSFQYELTMLTIRSNNNKSTIQNAF